MSPTATTRLGARNHILLRKVTLCGLCVDLQPALTTPDAGAKNCLNCASKLERLQARSRRINQRHRALEDRAARRPRKTSRKSIK